MKTFLVALLAFGFTSTALAQGQGGRGFGGGVLGLVSITEVQSELKLTDAQKEKFQALRGEWGNQQNLSREERQKRNEELAKKVDETVKSELDESQQQRLAELRIQREGGGSLARAEVAEKLELDEAQKEQIAKILAENTPTDRPNLQNATQEAREKLRAEGRARREKTNAALLAVLTSPQSESFEKMKGAAFTFPPRRRGQ